MAASDELRIDRDDEPAAGARPRDDLYAEKRPVDLLFYALTIAIFAATLVTDFFVVVEHWLNTYKSWAYLTAALAFVPSCFLQILSLKWYRISGDLTRHQWISHIFHFAIMHRFCLLLNSAIKTMKIQLSPQHRDWILQVENDAFTLNMFTSLLVSVPQIILQIYTMAVLQHVSFWTSASVIASICSLTWGLTAYALLINRTNQDNSHYTWSSMMIQGFWRGGMLASRIAALVLAAMCFKAWMLVIFGIHALGMTVWIIQQTTNFCLTAVEELVYKCLIGAVYFFDFLRLSDKQVRYHICIFYSIIIVQNVIFYTIYLVFFKDLFQRNVLIVSTILILGGSLVGAISMLIHFCMFQNVKTIKLCAHAKFDPELSIEATSTKNITSNKSPIKKWNNQAANNESIETISQDVTADKKSLLTNIVQNGESLEKGIVNTSFMKNDETNVTVQVFVEDSKLTNVDVSIEKIEGQSIFNLEKKVEESCNVDVEIDTSGQMATSSTDNLHRQKRRGICSEVELDLKTNDDCNIDVDPQLSQKRRGICSLTQLGLELVTDEDNYVEKSFTSVDKLKSISEVSLNIDQDKSIDSGILDSLPIKNLVTGNICEVVIPENILIRGRLNTPVISESDETNLNNQLSEKDELLRKQEEETMSHVTSIHDYENLCPLGVARPPWCIRSWKGYTDIETYIHDDSIVRDRRRDTLTSTATGTTLSSDFSDATYVSQPVRKLMKRSRQDDYLDTLIYDLVDWESISNKAPNEEISTTTTTISESINDTTDESSLFSAKPIVIDEKGGMLALDTIVEEREDPNTGSFPEVQMNIKKPSCSVSSLVATIDEIRKCTAENSPRHVYHRTESQWEDLEQKILVKRAHLTKVLFRSDYSNVTLLHHNSSYTEPHTSTSISEKSNDKLSILREVTNYCLKDSVGTTPLINAILSDSPILGPKTEAQTCQNGGLLEEDNVYVDMNALGAQRCSNEDDKESKIIRSVATEASSTIPLTSALAKSKDIIISEIDEKSENANRKNVAFLLTNEVIHNDSIDTHLEKSDSSSAKSSIPAEHSNSASTCCTDKRLRTINRPRRKFSLLRERFEPKSSSDQIVCVVSPTSSNEKIFSSRPQLGSLNKRISEIFNDPAVFDSSIKYDKKNLTGKSASVLDSTDEQTDSLRERRNVFLKQVLSPPRFPGWGRKRTFSPNAKIIPKAH
ncbi:uncharacterized protein LOC100679287 isoform X2 [Nasonia vitripennis]|uniref:XK-related protein n=1 Tax=Nasonia vitripennis TaxID=7425 RepID=A0A7M7HD40_NASVI|nr:uncharacterized protein LOC100679287 isoform X2 [Nasonia vitripennis]